MPFFTLPLPIPCP
uniref:Uncharacterized protein n=1 Tax=Arundo donax TaxID=35708 RepID=A0A0A9EMB8_ARUDO